MSLKNACSHVVYQETRKEIREALHNSGNTLGLTFRIGEEALRDTANTA